MDGSGVRASAGAPEELSAHGQVSPGTFSQPPGMRRKTTPPTHRSPSFRCSASIHLAAAAWRSFISARRASFSACSRRTRICARKASRSGSRVAVVGSATLVVTGDAAGALNRADQASPVFKCSQIPAPAMPSSRTAHMPSHGNSQRVRGMGCRYSGRSRSIRPPRRPARIVPGCRGGAPTEAPHTRWRRFGPGTGRTAAGGSASGPAITLGKRTSLRLRTTSWRSTISEPL